MKILYYSSLLLVLALASLGLAQDFVLDQTQNYTGPCKGQRWVSVCAIRSGGGRYGGWDTTNIKTCGPIQKQGDQLAMLYDVRYNGSLTWSYGPSSNGNCPKQSNTSTYLYTLYVGNVGPIPGTSISRRMWDDNPYFMGLRYYTTMARSEGRGLDTWGKARFMSSTSRYIYSRPWKLSSTRLSDGSGFAISGELDNLRYDGLNDMAYRYAGCRSFFSGSIWESGFLTKGCNIRAVTMNGTITANKADITYTVGASLAGPENETPRSFHFVGERVGKAELLLDGKAPAATGSVDGAAGVIARSSFSDATLEGESARSGATALGVGLFSIFVGVTGSFLRLAL